MATRVIEYHAPKAAARIPPMSETRYTWPYFFDTSMLVCSIRTEKGIRGIHEMKQMVAKIENRRKTIPPDQYLRESM